MSQAENQWPQRPGRFCIDGLNLAYWGGRAPSLRAPLTLLTQLLATGHEAKLYFDASSRHRLAAESPLYEQLLQHPRYAVEVPAGRTADGLLLRDARASEASLISRDHFADHRRRYRKLIDDPTRRFAGWVEQEQLCLPALGIQVPLPATAPEAWQRLAPWLAASATRRSEPIGNAGLAALLAMVLFVAVLPPAQAVVPAPPTTDEVRFNTEALVRARLRLPDSLRDFTVTQIAPAADDPARFAVTVQFKAKAPFGGVTEHTARFLMKRSTSGRVWIVTAD